MASADKVPAFIFARGGSKSVPRKNIRPMAGKPLIAHAIEAALAAELVDSVIVSTDDEEIAAVAREWGARTPFMRPAELAGDASPEWLAWRHALEQMRGNGGLPSLFVSVPATAPLREPGDIDSCIRKLRASPDADAVITVTPSSRNPYFDMVTLDATEAVRLVMSEAKVWRRQDAPRIYDITPLCYVVRPGFILSAERLFAGRIAAVVVPAERAVDIDTELDFRFAEFLLTQKSK